MINCEILNIMSLHFCLIFWQSRLVHHNHTYMLALYLACTAVHVHSRAFAFIILTYLTYDGGKVNRILYVYLNCMTPCMCVCMCVM